MAPFMRKTHFFLARQQINRPNHWILAFNHFFNLHRNSLMYQKKLGRAIFKKSPPYSALLFLLQILINWDSHILMTWCQVSSLYLVIRVNASSPDILLIFIQNQDFIGELSVDTLILCAQLRSVALRDSDGLLTTR